MKTIHFNGSDESIELTSSNSYCRQSAQCLRSSSGSVWRISQRLKRYGETPEDLESLVILTEFPTANPISQTEAEVQGNPLRECEQKFADLPELEKLTKLCSNAGFSKNIEKGQFFTYT